MATTAITASPIPSNAPTSEISSSFTRQEIITALFISTITVLTSLLWGIPFGLIGGASSFILAWGTRAAVATNLVEELHLDPAQELLPHYAEVQPLQGDALESHTRNISSLEYFEQTITRAICRQSLHYRPIELLPFMRDHFQGIDFSRLTLLGLKPIRLEDGTEGYETVIQSSVPQGWIHLFISNTGYVRGLNRDSRFTRIPQLTPFIEDWTELAFNHFSTFILPFRGRTALSLEFTLDFPDMDLLQVELESCRPIRFDFHHEAHHGMQAFDEHYPLGFELAFSTPRGIVRYYTDSTGQHVANVDAARNVEFLHYQ